MSETPADAISARTDEELNQRSKQLWDLIHQADKQLPRTYGWTGLTSEDQELFSMKEGWMREFQQLQNERLRRQANKPPSIASAALDAVKTTKGILTRNGTVFSCKNGQNVVTYALNETERAMVDLLWVAARDKRHCVDKKALLKDANSVGSANWKDVKKAFSSSDGRRFYDDFVGNDRKGHYQLIE